MLSRHRIGRSRLVPVFGSDATVDDGGAVGGDALSGDGELLSPGMTKLAVVAVARSAQPMEATGAIG
jgi:hypothetical protein